VSRHRGAGLLALALAVTACTSATPARAHSTPARAVHAAARPTGPHPARRADGSPLRLLALGDSRTSGGQWPAELARLTASVGVPIDVTDVAVGGTDCMYWTSRIAGLLARYDPDIVVLACGTNDSPTCSIYGESCTGWSFRYITETVHYYRPSSPVAYIPALVQYSDPILAPGWLLANEPQNNDHLYQQYHYYQSPARTPGWWARVADFQVIPSTATYLVADPYPDPAGFIGIHPTPRGYRYMGRIVFDAGAADGLWPPAAEEPLCDLYGHRNGYARPAYTPCPEP
jgi:hypothetical protein